MSPSVNTGLTVVALVIALLALLIGMLVTYELRTADSAPPPTQTPMLTDTEALMAVGTHLINQQVSTGDNSLHLACTAQYESESIPSETAYKNNGKWTVLWGLCLFVVDDNTGQVTGP